MNALDKFATKQRLKKAFMDKTANPANAESLKMNALEKYVTKTKLAHVLREKLAQPLPSGNYLGDKSLSIPPIQVSNQGTGPVREVKRTPKLPPAPAKSPFIAKVRKKLPPAKPGLKWTGKRTATKVKALGGPKNRPLVARSGGQLILKKTDSTKAAPKQMMATGY